MSTRRHRAFVVTVLVFALALSGCSTEATSPTREAPRVASPPEIGVTMREYRYELTTTELPAGRVVFRFRNLGAEPHSPALLPLDEDVPPINEQVRSPERRLVAPFASLNERRPGATGTFAVDLVAGRRYALICYATAPDDEAHSRNVERHLS